MYDFCNGGGAGCYDIYGCNGIGLSNNIYLSVRIGESSSMYYCYDCFSCSICLACVGLKNKSYCIFNKQYSKEGDLIYPAATTLHKLEAGMYIPVETSSGTAVTRTDLKTMSIIKYEDSVSSQVFEEVQKFWTLKDKYIERKEPHKRGFLFHGPPGGGKTSIALTIAADFIEKNDGIVLVFTPTIVSALRFIRSIEPDRKIILLIEDIDTVLERYSDHVLLSLLDGEIKLTNVVILATTNYIERLSDRIKNRPSRFDRVTYIGNPGYDHRYKYFKIKNTTNLSEKELEKYAKDTEEFSFAHLKELLTATEVYSYAYQETLERLKSMQKAEDNSNNYVERIRRSANAKSSAGVGFGA
jgi:SpoVK/Ycf46/Vps4 family AAA+-type ATPase